MDNEHEQAVRFLRAAERGLDDAALTRNEDVMKEAEARYWRASAAVHTPNYDRRVKAPKPEGGYGMYDDPAVQRLVNRPRPTRADLDKLTAALNASAGPMRRPQQPEQQNQSRIWLGPAGICQFPDTCPVVDSEGRRRIADCGNPACGVNPADDNAPSANPLQPVPDGADIEQWCDDLFGPPRPAPPAAPVVQPQPAQRNMAGPRKPSARRNDEVIAIYEGQGWRRGRCAIGKCDHTIAARDYNDALAMMQQHRNDAHA